MSETAQANGRNMYYTGMHGPEDPDDAIARLALVRERDQLQARIEELEAETERLRKMFSSSVEASHELATQNEVMRAALLLSVQAMRAPLDGWKGEVERKALDAANVALALPDIEGEVEA